jgi:hypothetical protein
MNRNGAATLSLVKQLEETQALVAERGPLRAHGDNGPMLAGYDEKIAAGREYEQDWRTIMHGGVDALPPRDALSFKREWSAWGKDARDFDSIMRKILALPPDELEQFLDEMYPPSDGR